MKNIGFLFKAKDDALFKIKPKRPAYVLNPLKAMLNLFVDRISLKQLDYKMEWNGMIFLMIKKNFRSDIVITLPFLMHIFNLSKPIN